MGGGPTAQQNQAASAQTALDQQLGNAFSSQLQFQQNQQNKANPFFTSEMNQGNPYFSNQTDAMSGNNAAAFAPAKAQLDKSLGQNANSLPSGFATGAQTDLASQQARSFDQGLSGAQQQNFNTKQQGAAGIVGQGAAANPSAFSGQAIQGNSSVMNAPLATPGLGGLLAGLGGGLASALPF
jgi:hypothetical protein